MVEKLISMVEQIFFFKLKDLASSCQPHCVYYSLIIIHSGASRTSGSVGTSQGLMPVKNIRSIDPIISI